MPGDIRTLIHRGISNNLETLKTNAIICKQSEQLWKVMNGLFAVTNSVLAATDKDDLPDQDFAKLLICANSLSDLVSVTHLLQIGFFRPAGTVLRGVVENVSLAVAIHQKPELFEQYRKGKYHIPDAVTLARKFIDQIGKVNGLLSNMFTHEPHETIGRGIRVSEGSSEIMLVPGIDQGHGRMFSIVANITAMSAVMLGESLEWSLAAHLENFVFWDRVDAQTLRSKPGELKTTAREMAAELERLMKADSNPSL